MKNLKGFIKEIFKEMYYSLGVRTVMSIFNHESLTSKPKIKI